MVQAIQSRLQSPCFLLSLLAAVFVVPLIILSKYVMQLDLESFQAPLLGIASHQAAFTLGSLVVLAGPVVVGIAVFRYGLKVVTSEQFPPPGGASCGPRECTKGLPAMIKGYVIMVMSFVIVFIAALGFVGFYQTMTSVG